MLIIITTILFTFILILLLFIHFLKAFPRRLRPGEPPIVKGSSLFGSAREFSQDAVQFLHLSQKRYGDVFTARLVNQYLTIIMCPHSYETVTREKKLDFDPIQKQVNKNVFSYSLHDAKKMISETSKTVRGEMMLQGLENFADNLNIACERISVTEKSGEGNLWQSNGLHHFVSTTIFDAIFNTVFGRDDNHAFNAELAFEKFETFHQYFNYLWLGFPIGLFPAAAKSLKAMFCMPNAGELLSRGDLSVFLRRSLECMQKDGQTEMDMKSHSLVYLHVNYNTFRLAFWALNNLIEDEKALAALVNEVDDLIKKVKGCDMKSVHLGVKDIESMKVLDSIVQETCRLTSGVFMIRYVTEDTYFITDGGQEFLFRKGDRVAIYPPALHKDPDVFENPLVFKFDRFVNAKFYKAGKEVKHPVMGFGTICPGKRYALLQLKWYILIIVTRFDLRLQPGQHAEYDSSCYGHEILPPINDVQFDYRIKEHSYPQILFSCDSSNHR